MRLWRRCGELTNRRQLIRLRVALKGQQTAHNGLPLVIPRERLHIRAKHPPLRARVELRTDLSPKHGAQCRVSNRHSGAGNAGVPKRSLQFRLVRQGYGEDFPDWVVVELPKPLAVNLREPI